MVQDKDMAQLKQESKIGELQLTVESGNNRL